jgi:ethanolamine transporter EutH
MIESLVLIFSNITFLLLLAALVIFGILTLQYRKIKSFQFQISIVLTILIASEIIDVMFDFEYIENPILENLGSFIHVISMVGIALVFWARFYHSVKTRKKFVDEIS